MENYTVNLNDFEHDDNIMDIIESVAERMEGIYYGTN